MLDGRSNDRGYPGSSATKKHGCVLGHAGIAWKLAERGNKGNVFIIKSYSDWKEVDIANKQPELMQHSSC